MSCDRMPRSSRPSVRATLLFELSRARAVSAQAVYSLAQDVCKDTYNYIYAYTHIYIYMFMHTYIYIYVYIDVYIYICLYLEPSLFHIYVYLDIDLDMYRIEGVIHMMYGLCVGGALTRTVEPPNKASVPRCILGHRWVHTAVPSRVRHAACRALHAVRWLLRCCVTCNWLRCMLRNVCGARCIMPFHANASRRMQRDASCVSLLHFASTSSVGGPPGSCPSRLERAACCALRAHSTVMATYSLCVYCYYD